MPGSKNLVVFLGIALVIVRFWTSGQRTAMSSLWSAGSSSKTTTKTTGTSSGGPPTGSPVYSTPTTGYSTKAACKAAYPNYPAVQVKGLWYPFKSVIAGT
jgi:hypothetical protein